ncbi:TolC family protein, partial [Ralstonia pseudosolanacearum]
LRRAVGAELPAAFDVDAGSDAESAAVHNLPPLADLVGSVLATHPDLEADRAAVREAEARLAHERSQRWPSLALRGSVDRQPDLQDSRVGLVVSIPLFDRREGPVGEAVAALERARATLRDRELQMRQAVESAYRQYEIAQSQVGALESGVVKQAESTLRVAEAAYRHGERGILDYLDAQRVFRQARNDLIAARADLRAAAVELDRLRAEAP